ncbi:hypothetical protein FACS1894186_6270 [Alphaproteobacteria bacterium]|nr:hypothetical protein FACS1894186_6270 [Alphaproteobacteria bacterium]
MRMFRLLWRFVWKNILLFLAYFLMAFVAAAFCWINRKFGVKEISLILLQLFSPLHGVDMGVVWSFSRHAVIVPLLAACAGLYVSRRFRIAKWVLAGFILRNALCPPAGGGHIFRRLERDNLSFDEYVSI